jgi:hypothetical protein
MVQILNIVFRVRTVYYVLICTVFSYAQPFYIKILPSTFTVPNILTLRARAHTQRQNHEIRVPYTGDVGAGHQPWGRRQYVATGSQGVTRQKTKLRQAKLYFPEASVWQTGMLNYLQHIGVVRLLRYRSRSKNL